jgi:hypothetical protein
MPNFILLLKYIMNMNTNQIIQCWGIVITTSCNQKERVRDHTVLWLPARSLTPLCFSNLLHKVHTSESHNTRLVLDSHRRPLQDQRCTNALLSHHYNTKFTQIPAKKILSLQAIYIARKHKHAPHQNVHKSADFQFFFFFFLSLSHPSTATRPVTRHNGITLAFNQAPSNKPKKPEHTISSQNLMMSAFLSFFPPPTVQSPLLHRLPF